MSFADELTIDNPYYFRAQTPNSVQGRWTAEYVGRVLKIPRVNVVVANDAYGQSFLAGFTQGSEKREPKIWSFDADSAKRSDSLQTIVGELAQEPEGEAIAYSDRQITRTVAH